MARAVFFFNDTATTEIYTLSLHDALPISALPGDRAARERVARGVFRSRGELERGAHLDARRRRADRDRRHGDRKSTRLNSSHSQISYAGFCLKRKEHLLSTRAVSQLADWR